jgi:hypothetical protein
MQNNNLPCLHRKLACMACRSSVSASSAVTYPVLDVHISFNATQTSSALLCAVRKLRASSAMHVQHKSIAALQLLQHHEQISLMF